MTARGGGGEAVRVTDARALQSFDEWRLMIFLLNQTACL